MNEQKNGTKAATAANVYQKLAQARVEFLQTPTKKSGVNKFAGFNYFELADILPVITPIFTRIGLLTTMTVGDAQATMTVINTDNPEETITFVSPVRFPELKGQNPIQVLGSVHTYLRRYLWMLVLDLVECDGIDATAGAEEHTRKSIPQNQKQTADLTNVRRMAAKIHREDDVERYIEKKGGSLTVEEEKVLFDRLNRATYGVPQQ